MQDTADHDTTSERVAALVEAAKKAGAEAADAVIVRAHRRGVSARLGKVESTESSESDDMSLRVFVGRRAASVSATPGSDFRALAERAVAMAKASPEDPCQGLADPDLLATALPDLDLFDATEVSTARLREDALAAEEAALAVSGVRNSSGSGASAGTGGLVLATSHGFVGEYALTRFSRSVAVIAGEGTGMERDYDFSSRLHFTDLEAPETVGRRAGERAARRLDARKLATGRLPVVFDPRVARGIAGHIAAAINGAAVARKTSFLRDRMGVAVAAPGITVTDNPLLRRGPGSRPFDGEGVAGGPLTVVEDGVLRHWLLSSSAARELGLATNGRGARAASSVNPAATNFAIEAGGTSPADLIAGVTSGFYVTEVFGHGVDMVTGDYSRGAAGFRIENGELTHPVAEVTIASSLKDMFAGMTPADDLDRNFATAAPTLLIEGMTVAGE